MRRNIRLTLMYDGTNYNGWQRLSDTEGIASIQGLLEQRLSEIIGSRIHVIGSGRTDAGVHALHQVCNFYTNSTMESDQLLKELNLYLPEDVRILSAQKVSDNFHSRYDALSKVYEYRLDIRERESVFTRKYSYPTLGDLDINRMKSAALLLTGTHDFKAFQTDRKDGKSTIRNIQRIHIYCVADNRNQKEVRIECTGDGFLHHMVRIIAGTLYEIGKGQRQVESVRDALESKERSKAGILLEPKGLFLTRVNY